MLAVHLRQFHHSLPPGSSLDEKDTREISFSELRLRSGNLYEVTTRAACSSSIDGMDLWLSGSRGTIHMMARLSLSNHTVILDNDWVCCRLLL